MEAGRVSDVEGDLVPYFGVLLCEVGLAVVLVWGRGMRCGCNVEFVLFSVSGGVTVDLAGPCVVVRVVGAVMLCLWVDEGVEFGAYS